MRKKKIGRPRGDYSNAPWPNKLRETREALGKTTVEAAAFCRVTVAVIFRWENGVTAPNYMNLPRVIEFYGKDLADLYPDIIERVKEIENE